MHTLEFADRPTKTLYELPRLLSVGGNLCDVYGHFDISIGDTDNLIVDDTLLEVPGSVEEFDPILNSPVKFVRVNTSYKQKVKVVMKDDFEVSGLIWFVLEPICIPYEVEFVISYRSGKMKIKKTNSGIDYKTYKQ